MTLIAPRSPNTPKPSQTPVKATVGDRFIPTRSSMDMDMSNFKLTKENGDPSDMGSDQQDYSKNLAESLLGDHQRSKILAFTGKAPTPAVGADQNLRVLYSQNRLQRAAGRSKTGRHIPTAPERILDAPEMVDDYYLNLLSWSDNSVLAVALNQSVCLWNSTTGDVQMLMSVEGDNYITSVEWMPESNYIAIGTDDADVQLWDAEQSKQVRSMRGHHGRVGALAWNQHILSSGSRDSSIFHHDVRVPQHHVATLEGHKQEVCGLKWSPDGTQLASGGNDNLLCIWDAKQSTPKFTLSHHQAAVKALAWCPWQSNLLASGGGTADRTLRFWNTSTGACLNSIDTKSQVCSIMWSPFERELITSHGFSQNQLCLWKYPSLAKVAEFTGHTSRVLHLALSPDGETVVSAAGDETLRFWKCFGRNARPRSLASEKKSSASMSNLNIR